MAEPGEKGGLAHALFADQDQDGIRNGSEWGKLAACLGIRVPRLTEIRADEQPENGGTLQTDNSEQQVTTPRIDPIVTPLPEYLKDDEADEILIADLKTADLSDAPDSFQYKGIAKEKPPKVEIAGRMSPPRDRQIAINALCHAQYRCEYNEDHPTFLRRNSGKPYTEPHHLVPMAFSDDFDVSLDVEENIVSLCSNCHNHIHYGQGADELLRVLFAKRKEALKSVGIDITIEQLLKYYQ